MSKTKTNMQRILVLILAVVAVNIVSSFVYTRLDLTAEKRYTLSEATKDMLRDLDDIVYVKVYLEGEFPAGFKRLRNETREMLNEFSAYSSNVEFVFINPSEKANKEVVQKTYEQLMQKGLQPTSLQVKTKDGYSEQVVFPGAIISFKEKEVPVQLLQNQIGTPAERVLNNSIQSLEYVLASAIKTLSQREKPKVAFIEGHGELSSLETGDIAWGLSDFYQVKRVRLNEQINSLTERTTDRKGKTTIANKFKAIIIAKPDSAFSEKDKFIIDQFIMNGGKVLWCVDPVFASMDSLQSDYQTISFPMQLNLEDMLFKYGIRLNANLVLDRTACPIPVVTGQSGNQPKQTLIPWLYFPMVSSVSAHPVVKNINAVKFEFVSSIDTVAAPAVKKTVLLASSDLSAMVLAPAPVSLELLMREPDIRAFNKSKLPLAVLLEGRFTSVFKNRLTPQLADNAQISFKDSSTNTSMIVIADGDVIRNQIREFNGRPEPLPLGFDKYVNQTFGNRELIMNCMNYLCDDSGLISIRSREIKLRLLDKKAVEEKREIIQLANLVLPVLLVLLFGLIKYAIRRQKYTSFEQ